jgi:flagellar hook assembly protein FlgD
MTPTLTLPTHTPTQTALSLVPVFTATAVVTAGVPQDSSMAGTIVFAKPPVNINASFADGPGVYRLEIVDARGAHINTLYNEQVVLEKDTWIIWDGTNDQGQRMGYGNYQALLSKDGVLIEKIALVWITPWTTGFE